MIGADAAFDWGHRTFRGRLDAFALNQRDRDGGLRISHPLTFSVTILVHSAPLSAPPAAILRRRKTITLWIS
jgi:hypothetical protein